MTSWKPYPEITVQAGNVESLYRLQTVSGRVIIAGHFNDESEASRLVSCWNAVRKIAEPENHIPATDDYVKRLEGLRKEAWARVQELEGGAVASVPAGWSFDITTAPRGKTITATRLVSDKNSASGKSVKDFEEFREEPVILATKCGKVVRSYWLQKEGRWAGFAQGEQPVAWMAWPTHPNHSNTDAAISSHRLAILDGPSAANRSEEEATQGDASGGVQDGMLPVHPADKFGSAA